MSVIALVSVFVIPSGAAFASDPLLSGYGGPGGGEQVVIGTKVLPPANGDGGLRQVTPSGSSETSSSSKPSAKPKREKNKAAETPETASKPVYPTEASTASALPLAKSDVLVLLIGAGTVGLIAYFFRRYRPTDQ